MPRPVLAKLANQFLTTNPAVPEFWVYCFSVLGGLARMNQATISATIPGVCILNGTYAWWLGAIMLGAAIFGIITYPSSEYLTKASASGVLTFVWVALGIYSSFSCDTTLYPAAQRLFVGAIAGWVTFRLSTLWYFRTKVIR